MQAEATCNKVTKETKGPERHLNTLRFPVGQRSRPMSVRVGYLAASGEPGYGRARDYGTQGARRLRGEVRQARVVKCACKSDTAVTSRAGGEVADRPRALLLSVWIAA